MRIWTIWTLPTMSVSERLRRTRDWVACRIAAGLPLRIRYWSTILAVGKVTTSKAFNERELMKITLGEFMESLEHPKEGFKWGP